MKYWGLLCFLLCITTSCQNTKSKQDNTSADMSPIFSKEDTVKVAGLATEYLEHLKKKEFDEAIQMLHNIQNDSILELSEQEKKNLMQQYKTFPVLSYQIGNLIFNNIYDAEVRYCIEFFKKKDGQEEIPNTMNFRLNSQKIKDEWHLGVLNMNH